MSQSLEILGNSAAQTVKIRPVFAENKALGQRIDGVIFTGFSREVISTIEKQAGVSEVDLLESVVNRLLVKKGTDWTSALSNFVFGVRSTGFSRSYRINAELQTHFLALTEH
jgi:hypothetical protein